MGRLVTETPFSEITATLEMLDLLGVERKDLARFRKGPSWVRLEVARLLKLGERVEMVESTASQKRAYEIMGKNVFCINEAIDHFGVNPTRQQLAVLAEIPFSEAVLEELKDNHILVAFFPFSIIDIRNNIEQKLFCSYKNAWYNNQSFAKTCGEVSWQLIRKTIVPGSTSKNWRKQQILLGKDDEVPSAREIVYTIIGYYLATGERLFKDTHVRTASVDSNGCRVYIGPFTSNGLSIDAGRDDQPGDNMSISSARRHDK